MVQPVQGTLLELADKIVAYLDSRSRDLSPIFPTRSGQRATRWSLWPLMVQLNAKDGAAHVRLDPRDSRQLPILAYRNVASVGPAGFSLAASSEMKMFTVYRRAPGAPDAYTDARKWLRGGSREAGAASGGLRAPATPVRERKSGDEPLHGGLRAHATPVRERKSGDEPLPPLEAGEGSPEPPRERKYGAAARESERALRERREREYAANLERAERTRRQEQEEKEHKRAAGGAGRREGEKEIKVKWQAWVGQETARVARWLDQPVFTPEFRGDRIRWDIDAKDEIEVEVLSNADQRENMDTVFAGLRRLVSALRLLKKKAQRRLSR
jgi:hypothetical protein